MPGSGLAAEEAHDAQLEKAGYGELAELGAAPHTAAGAWQTAPLLWQDASAGAHGRAIALRYAMGLRARLAGPPAG